MKKLTTVLLFSMMANLMLAQQFKKLDIHALDSMIVLLYDQGNFEEARLYINERLAFSKGIDSSYSQSLNILAEWYMQTGQYDSTEITLKKTLLLREKIYGKKHPEYAMCLSNLAYIYDDLGLYERAELLNREAAKIYELNGMQNSPRYSSCLSNLAGVYRRIGQLDLAESLYKQSIEIEKKNDMEGSPSFASSLNNLAALNKDLGQYETALSLYLKALDIWQETSGPESPKVGLVCNNIALVYEKMDSLDIAEQYYRRSIAIRKKKLGTKHHLYGIGLANFGVFLNRAHHFDEAEKCFVEAEHILLESLGTQQPNYILIHNYFADLYISSNKFEKAESHLKTAISLNLNLKNEATNTLEYLLTQIDGSNAYYPTILNNSLINVYQMYKKQYQQTHDKKFQEKSINALKKALYFNNELKSNFSSDSDKLEVLKSTHHIAGLLLSTHNKDSKEDLAALFAYAELNKSVLLSEAIRSQKSEYFGNLPDSILKKEQEFGLELDKLKKQEAEIGAEKDKKQLLEQINALKIKQQAFKKELEIKHADYFRLKYQNALIKAADIQKQLKNNQLILEYFIADSVNFVFALSDKDIQLYPIDDTKKELNKHIHQLRKALSDYTYIKTEKEAAHATYIESAFWLYQKLLVPALKAHKDKKHLIIITDAELGHLPFESFLTQKATATTDYSQLPYLIRDVNISYNYSAALWKENLSQKEFKNGNMLAIAASYKGVSDSLRTRANRAPHLRNLRDALQDLPAAKEEVAALSKLFNGEFWQNNNSNEKNFKKNAAQYGIIHLAMHGILNQRAPILSSLAFTENGDSIEDNFLEAWEISHLKLNAQLVVLSACETGYGKFQQGEGVMSLARSFMYAGVPALVVSLWQVNDASTSIIMQAFYKNLAKGMDKAEALQKAKLEYIKMAGAGNPDAAHPAFWAPFVQLGDSRPIQISQKGSGIIWWIAGGGLLAVAGAVFALRLRRKEK